MLLSWCHNYCRGGAAGLLRWAGWGRAWEVGGGRKDSWYGRKGDLIGKSSEKV